MSVAVVISGCSSGSLFVEMPPADGARSMLVATFSADGEVVQAVGLERTPVLELAFADPLELEIAYFRETLAELELAAGPVGLAEEGAAAFVAPPAVSKFAGVVRSGDFGGWTDQSASALRMAKLRLAVVSRCPTIRGGTVLDFPPDGAGGGGDVVGSIGDALLVKVYKTGALPALYAVDFEGLVPVVFPGEPQAVIRRTPDLLELIDRQGDLWSGTELAALTRAPLLGLHDELVASVVWTTDPASRVRAWAVASARGGAPRRVVALVGQEWVDRSGGHALGEAAFCVAMPGDEAFCLTPAALDSLAIFGLTHEPEVRPIPGDVTLTYVSAAAYVDGIGSSGLVVGANVGRVFSLSERTWIPLGDPAGMGSSGVGEQVEDLVTLSKFLLTIGGVSLSAYDIKHRTSCPPVTDFNGRPSSVYPWRGQYLSFVNRKFSELWQLQWIEASP